jgi:hypothetical protein
MYFEGRASLDLRSGEGGEWVVEFRVVEPES